MKSFFINKAHGGCNNEANIFNLSTKLVVERFIFDLSIISIFIFMHFNKPTFISF